MRGYTNTAIAPPAARAPKATLTAADRCDRCGAQAYVRARLTSGRVLLFCAHHGRESIPGLRKLEARIHDESDRLLQEELNSAPVGAL